VLGYSRLGSRHTKDIELADTHTDWDRQTRTDNVIQAAG